MTLDISEKIWLRIVKNLKVRLIKEKVKREIKPC